MRITALITAGALAVGALLGSAAVVAPAAQAGVVHGPGNWWPGL